MKTVVLHGALAERFGESFRFDVRSAAEAVRALAANFPDFLGAVREGQYRVAYGDENIGEDRLPMQTGAREIHIEPVVAGAGGGRKGFLPIVLGIALVASAFILAPAAPAIVAAQGAHFGAVGAANLGAAAFSIGGFAVTYGNLALFGAGLILSGVSSLLTQPPTTDYSGRERPDERPSFLFSGAVNAIEQGGPVPVVYGRHLVGSVVISGGLSVIDIGDDGTSVTFPELFSRASKGK